VVVVLVVVVVVVVLVVVVVVVVLVLVVVVVVVVVGIVVVVVGLSMKTVYVTAPIVIMLRSVKTTVNNPITSRVFPRDSGSSSTSSLKSRLGFRLFPLSFFRLIFSVLWIMGVELGKQSINIYEVGV
jgi:hypothetical protein